MIDILRAQVRAMLGVDLDDFPDQNDFSDPDNPKIGADQFLNEAYWELLDKFPFREKETTATFPTAEGTRFYKLPSTFEALREISIEDLTTGQHTPLERITQRQYETDYVNSTDNENTPTHYLREGDGIRLWPTPDDIYTLTIKYWTELTDLSDSSEPDIPRQWLEVLKFGAAWRGHFHFGNDSKALTARNTWTSLISAMTPTEAKEETDTHLGGLEVAGYDGEL